MSGTRIVVLFLVILAVVWSGAYAADPDPLQDFCVGFNDPKAAVVVNGKFCKNPENVTVEDFIYSGLNIPANTSNPLGTNVTTVFEDQLHGLNHQGISIIRIDYAPNGLNPPHVHPRATELILVAKGVLYAGFIGANPLDPNLPNKLYAKILYPGDVLVFPRGLLHFQLNVGKTDALVFATFDSQNPGFFNIPDALFGTEPPVYPDVLAKAFQMDKGSIEYLQSLTRMRIKGENY
ncbi:germin-like protein subfamily 1 member 16 [Primulina tabacum]|uniref:germin-like protein subfamily 1 member 16 n=1 Tax=Primulina tabacum TaxID=48773 RepID=UPI003F5AAFD9